MNPFPLMVEKETTLTEALAIMKERQISHLPIISENKLVGIIAKEDLLNAMLDLAIESSGKKYNEIFLKTTAVEKIMSTDLITARTTDTLLETISKMLDRGLHCIPVVNDDFEPIGLLHPMDVLKAYTAGAENIL